MRLCLKQTKISGVVFFSFVSGQGMDSLPFYILLLVLWVGAFFTIRWIIIRLRGKFKFEKKIQTNCVSLIISLLFVIGMALFQNYKLGHYQSDTCKEIGRDRAIVIEYIQRIESWFHNPETFNNKEYKSFDKSVNDWLSNTAKWIRKNLGDSAYADFNYDAVDDAPMNARPEARLESRLQKYSNNLIMIENNYCRGKNT